MSGGALNLHHGGSCDTWCAEAVEDVQAAAQQSGRALRLGQKRKCTFYVLSTVYSYDGPVSANASNRFLPILSGFITNATVSSEAEAKWRGRQNALAQYSKFVIYHCLLPMTLIVQILSEPFAHSKLGNSPDGEKKPIPASRQTRHDRRPSSLARNNLQRSRQTVWKLKRMSFFTHTAVANDGVEPHIMNEDIGSPGSNVGGQFGNSATKA
ncbi:MAG: hypothetical protein Q9184_002337 [Pyrenodesmia sp. 2 TL-2023]